MSPDPHRTQAEGEAPTRAERLAERLRTREATAAVIGLGYVGLPLCTTLFDAGYRILGVDTDPHKIELLGRGKSYLAHLDDETPQRLASSPRFRATNDTAELAQADVIAVCVPTPLGAHHEPDLRFVLGSMRAICAAMRPGQLVVLSSTTYPGTTRDECLPILDESGLVCGEDYFLAFSPEREDPGRAPEATQAIPRIVGGVDEISGDLAELFFAQVTPQVHRVESTEIAEAAKLLENIYRAVNVALVNELKVLLNELDIDVWSTIRAAATKPFGFQAFYPGPGLGGHCIPIDPFYLTWKAREVNLPCRFIELAGEVNTQMPRYVFERVAEALNAREKPLRGSKILICGVAYKANVGDIRETPAAPIIERLLAAGSEVAYHDPHVPHFPKMRKHHIDLSSVELTEERLRDQDCVLILTDHRAIDWELVGRHAPLIVDTRNAMGGRPDLGAKVVMA